MKGRRNLFSNYVDKVLEDRIRNFNFLLSEVVILPIVVSTLLNLRNLDDGFVEDRMNGVVKKSKYFFSLCFFSSCISVIHILRALRGNAIIVPDFNFWLC